MSILKNCCGCISLKTGTIIAGVIEILICILQLVLILTNLIRVKLVEKEDHSASLVVKVVLSVNLIGLILISILLVVGAIKRKKWFLVPWIIINIIKSIILLISLIWSAIIYLVNKEVQIGALFIVFGLVYFAYQMYMWFVVYSFFQVLYAEQNRMNKPYR